MTPQAMKMPPGHRLNSARRPRAESLAGRPKTGCPARHQLTTKDMDTYPQYANFLSDLKRERRWLVWRNEVRNGRATKVPYCARGGWGSSTDPQTWASYEEAADAVVTY